MRTAEPKWMPLEWFHESGVPKLNNLRRAQQAGIQVPSTWWLSGAEAEGWDLSVPNILGDGPYIVRSGSPTEDTRQTSNAGQLLSLVVREPNAFSSTVQQVVAALPQDAHGKPLGAIFVQSLLEGSEAGVAFFDGFYFEKTVAADSNAALTSGQERGEVTRGNLARNDTWSKWLAQIYAVFGIEAGGDAVLDIEYTRDERGYILLQVRPALFPVLRNETLSLANHKEILGDPPSPWIVSVLCSAGRQAMNFFAFADSSVRSWNEPYAVELAERAWMNFSAFYRLMDRWGLPRTFVTQGVGGEGDGPEDRRTMPGRLLRSLPRLLRLQVTSWRTIARTRRDLRVATVKLENADGLLELFQVNVELMELALRTNFAINGTLSGITRLRRLLRIPTAGRVVTQEMMEAYRQLGSLPAEAEKAAGLDAWLREYGHRGPLESDPRHPRFAEIREALLADLMQQEPASVTALRPVGKRSGLLKPFFYLDERREWFRDQLMRRWKMLRNRLLAEGNRLVGVGELAGPEDVFWLRGEDLEGEIPLRDAVVANRKRVETTRELTLPLTSTRDAIMEAVSAMALPQETGCEQRLFRGIPLSAICIEGRAKKADDLMSLLAEAANGALGSETILVVPALEPSWAVVFPRVGGVVAEIGGELSHASILLREAGRPAIVNCTGIFAQIRNGERLRLDGVDGVVVRLEVDDDG